MTEATAFPPTRRRRIAALILLTIVLHVLAIHWGKAYFNAANADARAASSVSVTLRQLELPSQPVSLPVAAAPESQKLPRPAKPRPPAPAVSQPSDAVGAGAAVNDTPATVSPPAPEPPQAVAAAEPTAPKNDSPPPVQGTQYHIDPPPSVELEYDVLAFSDNLTWHGTSTLDWKTDGSRYTVDGEVYTRLFAKIAFLNFTSSGEIGAFGVEPELYTEKKRNRAATNTHFNRERNLVSFSASTTSYPRAGGEQDRASLIWQLAAIGRGDSAKFAPGAVIDMFVAGVRDGEVWRMQVVGQEEIRLITGAAQVWHVVRQPRPGSYEQRLDIWLEPGRQWYPARLRFTETNGDYLELSLSKLKNP
jgi:hypothetical protein